MIVVSDTSVISNLIQIEQLDLLKSLFGKVVITESVKTELHRMKGHQSAILKAEWISVKSILNTAKRDALLTDLDIGEAESIVLAIETQADFLLIDEYRGRQIALNEGLKITGLLGLLILGKSKGYLMEVKPLIIKLQHNGFRLQPKLIEKVLKIIEED